MTRRTHWIFTQADYVIAYLVAMHGLMFANLFLAGRSVSTLVLLPLALVTLVLTARYLIRVLGQPAPAIAPLDLVVCAYLALSLVSLVLFAWPGNPAAPSAYLYGLSLQVLPMLMYFAVKGLAQRDAERILRTVVGLQAACALIGIPLFLARPDFYTAYLVERLGFTQDWQNYARLQSYMGSTATGILSAVAIVLLASVRMSRLLRYALALLFLFTIFLTQQRGAYVSGVLAIAYFLYRSKLSPIQLSAALAAVVGALLLGLGSLGLTTDLFGEITRNRIVDDLLLGDPFGERSVSYEKGLGFVSEHPLGLGVGATTSAAQDAGAHPGGQVVDAYYMRVASDLGVPGLALFLLVLGVAVLVSLSRPGVAGLGVIVVIYAFQSIGTNVLDTFFVSHVFWMLLGFAGAATARFERPGGVAQWVRYEPSGGRGRHATPSDVA